MIKQFFISPILLAIWLLLSGWGGTGHRKINESTSLSFTENMDQFNAWTKTLVDHASDADNRKSWDPNEGRKHYLDIDNYPDFINNGKIPQLLDSVILKYGQSFVYSQGLLPWATIEAFDSLKNCFERSDWGKAVLVAADLGHYVADGHMPLHISKNYDGQFTGNNGIHSRYESTMINENIGKINYEGDTLELIPDVNQYIFSYLYTNFQLVDSVIMADNYAKNISANYSSTAYKNALWNKTNLFTTHLFKNASLSITRLIYTAWVNSGSPEIIFNSALNEKDFFAILEQNIPNPFNTETQISFTLEENNQVQLLIKDILGNNIATLINGFMNKGDHTIQWIPENQTSGIYLLILNTGKSQTVKTIVLTN